MLVCAGLGQAWQEAGSSRLLSFKFLIRIYKKQQIKVQLSMKNYFRDYTTIKLYQLGKTEESDRKEKTDLIEERNDYTGTKRQAA